MLLASGWTLTLEIREQIHLIFSCFGQSKIVEDGWQRERHGEALHSSRRVWHGRMWLTPVYAHVLDQVHRFKEIDWQSQEAPRGQAPLPKSFCTSKNKDVSNGDLRQIVGSTEAPPWYSPSPLASLATSGDLHLTKKCATSGEWNCVTTVWLNSFTWADRTMLLATAADPGNIFSNGNARWYCLSGLASRSCSYWWG